jgi:hypothetical protein
VVQFCMDFKAVLEDVERDAKESGERVMITTDPLSRSYKIRLGQRQWKVDLFSIRRSVAEHPELKEMLTCEGRSRWASRLNASARAEPME